MPELAELDAYIHNVETLQAAEAEWEAELENEDGYGDPDGAVN